jgi:hypothetical protein
MTRKLLKTCIPALLTVALGGIVINASQTTRLQMVMREKLAHSEKLLDAVVTSNWAQMETHSLELQRLTRDPAWKVLTAPEYASQSAAFVRALDELLDAARHRDLEAAPLAYVTMTMRCVQCHRYVARMRTASDNGKHVS